MEQTLIFEYWGIKWLVECSVNDEWALDEVYSVSAWDENAKKYVPIPCNLGEFTREAQDFLFDAIEEEKQAALEMAADMKYEQAREGRL